MNDGYFEPKKLEKNRSLLIPPGVTEVGPVGGGSREPPGETKAEWSLRKPILGSFSSPARGFSSGGSFLDSVSCLPGLANDRCG